MSVEVIFHDCQRKRRIQYSLVPLSSYYEAKKKKIAFLFFLLIILFPYFLPPFLSEQLAVCLSLFLRFKKKRSSLVLPSLHGVRIPQFVALVLFILFVLIIGFLSIENSSSSLPTFPPHFSFFFFFLKRGDFFCFVFCSAT